MENKVKNSPLNIILVAVCSFVGVGFVTGAEIWFYFARFEINMIFGLFVFAVLSFLLIYFSLGGKSEIKSERYCKFKAFFAGLSELLIASAMIAGLMETSELLFGKLWLIVFLCAVFCVILILFLGFKSFVFYNYFVAIFIIFVIICLFSFNNNFPLKIEQNFNEKSAILSCIFGAIYIFMNIAEIRPILEENKQNGSKINRIFFSAALSLILIFLIVIMSCFAIANKNLSKFSMPFLVLFAGHGGVIRWVFLIGLVLSMISTAEACLIGVKNKINFAKNDENFSKIIVILSSLILGQIPFQFFIKIVYPFIAILNFLMFIFEIILLKKSRKLK